jgi:hypothetical protein
MLPRVDTLTSIPPVGDVFRVRSRRRVHLGPVCVDIRSNEVDFKGFRFFSKSFHPHSPDSSEQDAESHFTLSLCNLGIDGPWPLQALLAMQDKSYRAKRMSAGYYLTDHFGAPAYLITRGTHYWIFAEDFERILWPYAVKYLLTVYSMKHKLLHLKAAAVAVDGQGALLLGRGGSGKTVLLTCLCRAGAQFVSNTHALIDGQTVVGIQTAMRVRADRFFERVIAERRLSPAVKAGEYTADPISDLGWSSVPSALVRSVCLVDYKGTGSRVIQEIDRDAALEYLEQFALALNVYGLKEDILDSLGGEVPRFSVEMAEMRARLRALVRGSRSYYLSCDAAEPGNLRSIWGLLKGANWGL